MEISEGLTFDDVLLVPAPSYVVPGEVSTALEFIKISNSSFEESHVHNVQVTREAPNYRGE